MIGEYNDKLENVLPKIGNHSIDLIFADLPYGTTQAKWDSLIDLEYFWNHVWRILKSNGVVIATCQFPFTSILANSQLQHLKYDWVWEKTSATGHLNAKKMPMKAHENILIFYKNLPTYNPQKTQGHQRKVSTAYHKRNSKRTDIYSAHNLTNYDSTERYPRSVLEFASDKQKINLHSTQKPLKLVEYLLKTYTNVGDTVLDPCRGSNTTGVACDNLGLNYIGVEKDKSFYDIGLIRRTNPNLKTKELLKIYNNE